MAFSNLKFNPTKYTTYNPPSYQQPNPSYSPTNSASQPYRVEVSNTHQNAQSASEMGKKAAEIRHFINDVANPSIANAVLVQSLRQHVGQQIFNQICSDVSFALKGTRNSGEGENLLYQNFRILLRVKDANGNNPLDQLLDHYCNLQESYQAISEINNLAGTLASYKASLQNTQSSQSHFNSASLKDRAIEQFKTLSPKAKGLLTQRIWEIDNKPSATDYGYTTAIQGIEKLQEYRGSSPIQDCLTRLNGEKTASFSYTHTRICAHEILLSDTPAVVKDIHKLYHLEDLKLLLNDFSKTNEFIFSKYERMNVDIKEMLGKLVWMASYKPMELGFGDRFLRENMRALLKIQNSDRVDIVSQLISHYSEKVKVQRLERELENFKNDASRISDKGLLLGRFNQLSESAKDALRFRVWHAHGGHKDPDFGGWGYGTRAIESNPYVIYEGTPPLLISIIDELKEKGRNGDKVLFEDLDKSRTISENPVDVSTKPLIEESKSGLMSNLPPNLHVAHVTAELAGVASLGGLASAVDGIAKGFSPNKVSVIMPFYQNGPINESIFENGDYPPFHPLKKHKESVNISGQPCRVLKSKHKTSGIRCYFIDIPQVLTIPKKGDGTSGNFYDGDYDLVRRRWASFENGAASLCYKLGKKAKNPVNLVHVHDAQTALVPKFLKEHHYQEWERGETPATVFTFHNNMEPMEFKGETSTTQLEKVGLAKKEINSFIESLSDSDMVTTVSETFGKESQMKNHDFGNGMDFFVRKAATERKLYGIVNGNSNGWDPTKDKQLAQWKSVLPQTYGQTPNLTFGPNLNNRELAEKTKLIQREICAYLKQLDPANPAYADLDPEKPIVMYLGRFDGIQKGMDKFALIMEETLKNGGQFVCIGTVNPSDHKAMDYLNDLKKKAERYNRKGVLILEDNKIGATYVHQSVFGSMLRAACTLPIFPSRYEPCGLVQGEFNRFGKKAIATNTGGFADTLKTTGPDANGYLFNRMPVWDSSEQNEEIKKTLRSALEEAKVKQNAIYHGNDGQITPHMEQARTIMKNALNSTWEKTPDGSLSAIRRLELVYAKAFEKRKKRGINEVNLKTVKA